MKKEHHATQGENLPAQEAWEQIEQGVSLATGEGVGRAGMGRSGVGEQFMGGIRAGSGGGWWPFMVEVTGDVCGWWRRGGGGKRVASSFLYWPPKPPILGKVEYGFDCRLSIQFYMDNIQIQLPLIGIAWKIVEILLKEIKLLLYFFETVEKCLGSAAKVKFKIFLFVQYHFI